MHTIPNTPEVEKELLDAIGVQRFEDLLVNIPKTFLEKCRIHLPEPLSELEVSRHLQNLANQNSNTENMVSFLGGGAYDHFIPAVVDFLIGRSEFYTAYTPYQAEVSQGTLQSIYEYQSLICHLMDMEVANASMYDGATALAEAAIMSCGITKKDKVLASPLINPGTMKVLKTYLSNRNIEIVLLPDKNGQTDFSTLPELIDDRVAAVLVQSPNFLGAIEELTGVSANIHEKNAMFVLSVDPISLGILKSPGGWDADIAVAEGQPLGIHQSFGGPYLGVFSAKKALVRNMPGRIVGQTVDVDGKRGYVLVLQTREQHIRREKATSNICSNQGLMALAATIYLSLMGKTGLKQAATLCLNNSHYLAEKISSLKGFRLPYGKNPFFKEFVIDTPVSPKEIIAAGLKENFFAGIDLGDYREDWKNHLLIAVTEKRTAQEIDFFVTFLSKFQA
ncbi:MAG: aminomethyl-transferring glycine dehydrogenase subunit GcvPA [Candidatus Marinimicrobia bacterium]|nr:aminomethyl-transferring glycine dehydrogenase subunit GcvPA [Candidatus Neomarinimicrobiota bacterium]